MKVYFLFLIALLFLTGCNTSTGPADDTQSATREISESPGSSSKPTEESGRLNATPKDAIRAFVEAVKAKDEAGVKAALSEKTFKMLMLEAQLSGKKNGSLFESEVFEDIGDMPEIKDEKIEGEKATLEVREKGDSDWTKMSLVKVGESWKLAYADEAYDKSYEELSKKAGAKPENAKEEEPEAKDGKGEKSPESDN